MRERLGGARAALSQQQREKFRQQRRHFTYISYSLDRINFIRAQPREKMEGQREQETEEATELRREDS